MGGIPTNYHGEVLDFSTDEMGSVVPGLMAIGEAACVSVHGANRLGSNSLLDIIVFGRAAAKRAAELIKPKTAHQSISPAITDAALARFERFRQADGDIPTSQLRDRMQHIMQQHAAVFRTAENLQAGIDKLREVEKDFARVRINDRSLIWNTDLAETLELDNLLLQARTIIHSCINRLESRGAHARDDFPDRDDKSWMKHTLTRLGEDFDVHHSYRPVRLDTLTDECESIPPKARVY